MLLMEDEFRRKGFRKLTGPIEHWVTTFHTGYWGFRPDKKGAWEEIEEGEIFLFHASGSEFLDAPNKRVRDAGKGVIGIGRVGATSVKDEPAWWEEVHDDGNYPYLVHFSEIHWFGDTDSIRDAPVRQKSVDEMVDDIHALNENEITFGEMSERTGYRIPAQGSPGNIKHPEKLFPLLLERLHGVEPDELNTPESERETERSSGRGASSVRSRDRDRDLDSGGHSSGTVSYESSIDETMSGWMDHEHALDTFEDELIDAGFNSGETDYSDLLAWRNTNLVLAEAKSIHDSNERSQIRKALGQLYEYGYFDVEQDAERIKKDLTRCLVLTEEPSDGYREFLEYLQNEGIFTFWIDEYEVRGLSDSIERLEAITS